MKPKRPQDIWNEKNGLVSKTYKLKKEIVDDFAAACEIAGVSKKSQLEKMMTEFSKAVDQNQQANTGGMITVKKPMNDVELTLAVLKTYRELMSEVDADACDHSAEDDRKTQNAFDVVIEYIEREIELINDQLAYSEVTEMEDEM